MKHFYKLSLILSLFICLGMTPKSSQATSPCVPLTEDEFISSTLAPADLILTAEIITYSGRIPSPMPTRWTKVKIIDTHFNSGKALERNTLKIEDWQSHYEPLFMYKKGDKALVFLRKFGSQYILANDSWKQCVPALWTITEDNMIANPITHQKMTSEEFNKYIQNKKTKAAKEPKASGQ